MRISMTVLPIVAAAVLASQTLSGGKPRDIPLTITTSDGLELHAWLTPPSRPVRAPLLVLLPMRGHTHASFEPFIEAVFKFFATDSAAATVRPYILNFDLRGHGRSTRLGDRTVSYRDMENAHYERIPRDVAEMIAHVAADSNYTVDTTNILVVGASIGANSAALLTRLVPGIRRVAMLSPGLNYRGLVPEPAVKSYTGPMFICASADDSYSARSSRSLAETAGDRAQLRIYEGSAHGTDIINGDPQAMRELIRWLFVESD